MSDFDSPLDQIRKERKEKNRRRRQRESFESPVQRGVSRQAAARASGRQGMSAGQYTRKQFTLTDEQLNLLKQIAEDEGLSELAAGRWLIDKGLEAYFEHNERPEIEQVVSHSQPKLRYE